MEIARREALSAVEVIEAVLDCPVRSSRQRLEEVVFADLRYTFHLLKNRPKTLELAQIVVSDRRNSKLKACVASAACFSVFCTKVKLQENFSLIM